MTKAMVKGLLQCRDGLWSLSFLRKIARDVVQHRRIIRLHRERATIPVAGLFRFAQIGETCGTHVKGSRVVRVQLEMFSRCVVASSRRLDGIFISPEPSVHI